MSLIHIDFFRRMRIDSPLEIPSETRINRLLSHLRLIPSVAATLEQVRRISIKLEEERIADEQHTISLPDDSPSSTEGDPDDN